MINMSSNNLQPQQNIHHLCTVCQTEYPHLYCVAKCKHKFCQQCSIGYIAAQASHFSQAKCLQQGCKQPLDKSLPIYQKLDKITLHKLKQFQAYRFLQKNPDHASCKTKDCPGVFLIKDTKCNLCKSVHCKKCLNIKHQSKCVQDQNQKAMQKLKFKRCPTCRIWVERNKGCEYMQCKCGTDFCYKCGSQFSKDPCRKKDAWNGQSQLREILRTIPNIFTTRLVDIILLIPRITILFALLVPFTLMCCIIPLLFYFSMTCLFVTMCVPFGACEWIKSQPQGCLKCIYHILFIPLYPILCALSFFVFLIAFFLFPCFRRRDHHGIYDSLDKVILGASTCYLKGVKCLFQSLGCRQ